MPGKICLPTTQGIPHDTAIFSSYASLCNARNFSINCTFSSKKIAHVAYKKIPPGCNNGHTLSNNRHCCCTAAEISLSRRNNFISGWRRITPLPEQGASNRILSNNSPSHHVVTAPTSPQIQLACNCKRDKF